MEFSGCMTVFNQNKVSASRKVRNANKTVCAGLYRLSGTEGLLTLASPDESK